MHFGEHITIDGYGGDPELLDNGEFLKDCFPELCTLLDMHALIEPVVISAPDNQIKDPGGWSGFVIIAESHIAMHTFPKRGFISADVYTCQNGLEVEKIKSYFTKKFKLQEIETNFVMRGTKYPQENIF
jgi:S-adenosylmethionine decarboxylase